MLVLRRKLNESVVIPTPLGPIRIMLVEIRRGQETGLALRPRP